MKISTNLETPKEKRERQIQNVLAYYIARMRDILAEDFGLSEAEIVRRIREQLP